MLAGFVVRVGLTTFTVLTLVRSFTIDEPSGFHKSSPSGFRQSVAHSQHRHHSDFATESFPSSQSGRNRQNVFLLA